MEAVVFVIYLLAFCLIIPSISFIKKSGLSTFQLIILFVIKVAAGIGYAFFYQLPQYKEGSDTWRFYRQSLVEKKWLLSDPTAFLKDIFVYGYQRPGNIFAGENSYWNDLKSNIPVKMMAVMNVFTFDSYYTNIILFNFLFFIGLIAFFRFFNLVYPTAKYAIICGVFLIPSTLFWCSGVHKDGLLLSSIGIVIYIFYNWIITGKIKIGKVLLLVFLFFFIFLLRNYLALALVPAGFCFWWAYRLTNKSWLPFVIVYSIGIVLFFTLKYFHPSLDFPNYIVQKQGEFSILEGHSNLQTQGLQPTIAGFIKFLPTALDMAFFRPHLTEARSLSYLPAAIENVAVLVIICFGLFALRKQQNQNKAAFFFCLFYSLSILLVAGYTITLSGAIVRYRSLALPILITPFLCSIYRHLFGKKSSAGK